MNIHHNDISGAMMVCDDGGAIYQFCTDGTGSEIHHNWVFGTKGLMIYFDNHSFGWNVAEFTFTGSEKTPLYRVSPQDLISEDGSKKIEKTTYVEGSRVLLMVDHAFKHPGIWMTGSYDLN
jgi:hypothetical protein